MPFRRWCLLRRRLEQASSGMALLSGLGRWFAVMMMMMMMERAEFVAREELGASLRGYVRIWEWLMRAL